MCYLVLLLGLTVFSQAAAQAAAQTFSLVNAASTATAILNVTSNSAFSTTFSVGSTGGFVRSLSVAVGNPGKFALYSFEIHIHL